MNAKSTINITRKFYIIVNIFQSLSKSIKLMLLKINSSKVLIYLNIISLRKPVVYDGPADEEAIHETFMQWREPCQQDLTDTNFEHLTQASIEFYGSVVYSMKL